MSTSIFFPRESNLLSKAVNKHWKVADSFYNFNHQCTLNCRLWHARVQTPNCWSIIDKDHPLQQSYPFPVQKYRQKKILVWSCKDLIWPTDLTYDPAPGFTFLGMRYPPTTQAWSRSNGSKVTCSLGLNCSFWSFFTSWANTASAGTVESMQLACHK